MNEIFSEVATHQTLGRVIFQIGRPQFWRHLILLLNELLPFENALVSFNASRSIPVVLEEYDADDSATPSPTPLYLSGLYLLDPFWQACQTGLSDGLYRLEEVAPDLFRQSEYFLKYSRDAVGDDELQLILNVAPHEVLLLSLGTRKRFTLDTCGRLTICTPWILALMRQHWLHANAGSVASVKATDQLQQTLANFGAHILSTREMEIAQLILRGNSSKAIANTLSISAETVKVHRRHLYSKLGISSQPELFSLFLNALSTKLGNRS